MRLVTDLTITCVPGAVHPVKIFRLIIRRVAVDVIDFLLVFRCRTVKCLANKPVD